MVSDDQVHAGARPYTRPFLHLYDLWVVRLSNSLAWRCHRRNFLDQYDRLVASRHLEVGPGSGWAISHASRPVDTAVTLLDLNPNCLRHTAERLGGASVIEQSVFEPLPASAGQFDSIALSYVVHCIPGTWEEKSVALRNLGAALAPDGVLFGSTVVADSPRNLLGHALFEMYNAIGAFHSRGDDLAGLEAALRSVFVDVDISTVGNVALFTARQAKIINAES